MLRKNSVAVVAGPAYLWLVIHRSSELTLKLTLARYKRLAGIMTPIEWIQLGDAGIHARRIPVANVEFPSNSIQSSKLLAELGNFILS